MTDSPRPERALTKSSVGVSGSASDETRGNLEDGRNAQTDAALGSPSFLGSKDAAGSVTPAGPGAVLAEEVMRLVNERPLGMRASSGVWLRSVAYALSRHVVALTEALESSEVRLVGLSADVSRLTEQLVSCQRLLSETAKRMNDNLARALAAEARVAVLREAFEDWLISTGYSSLDAERVVESLDSATSGAGEAKP